MNAQNQNTTARGAGNTWIVALTVICVGIVGFGMTYSTNTISNPAFLAGQYLVYAFFIWAVFHVVLLRKRGAKVSAITFAALYAALFAGGLIAASQHAQQAVDEVSSARQEVGRFVSSIQQELSRFSSTTLNTSGRPSPIKEVPTGDTDVRDALGEMTRFIKESVDLTMAQQRDYELELEAIGWSSILDVQRINQDTALSESRMIIKRAKAIINKYENIYANRAYEAKSRINALNLPEELKAEAFAGFKEGMIESAPKTDETWRLEKQVVLQVENIFLLLANRQKWVVGGERILFYNDDDLIRFNSYIETIQRVVQQQEQIKKNILAETDQGLEILKNSVGK